MDGERKNWITNLTGVAGNVYVSGFTQDESMDLVQESGSVFSSGPNTSYPDFTLTEDGYFMKFAESNYSLVHSSYFGGEAYDEINTISVNQEGELYAFGRTRSLYNTNQIGVPVLDNDIPNNWYQENHVNAGNLDDIFGFKICSALLLDTDYHSELVNDSEIVIFPNPNKGDVLSIRNLGNCERIENLEIYDIGGKLVAAPESIRAFRNTNDYRIVIRNRLKSGTYFVQFSGCQTTSHAKFIVIE